MKTKPYLCVFAQLLLHLARGSLRIDQVHQSLVNVGEDLREIVNLRAQFRLHLPLLIIFPILFFGAHQARLQIRPFRLEHLGGAFDILGRLVKVFRELMREGDLEKAETVYIA